MYDLERKIIFTHPPKCAGTTIEMYFGWHPNTIKNASEEYTKQFKKFKHASLETHVDEITNIGYNPDEFFKISCVRNPWDVAVSYYFHETINAINFLTESGQELSVYLKKIKDFSFEEYIRYQYRRKDYNFIDFEDFFFINGENKIDYVVRYESLDKQMLELSNKYNFQYARTHHMNGNSRPKKVPYQSYYTSFELIDIVAELGKKTINTFNYTFF